jgi:hypothetical protein
MDGAKRGVRRQDGGESMRDVGFTLTGTNHGVRWWTVGMGARRSRGAMKSGRDPARTFSTSCCHGGGGATYLSAGRLGSARRLWHSNVADVAEMCERDSESVEPWLSSAVADSCVRSSV